MSSVVYSERIARMFDRSFGFVMGRVSRFLEDVPADLLQSATLQESEESSLESSGMEYA